MLHIDLMTAPPLLYRELLKLRRGPTWKEINGIFMSPNPLECYIPLVLPSIMLGKGYDITVALDYDIFTADSRLYEELPKIHGIGVVRIYPKECLREMNASEAQSFGWRGHDYYSFRDPEKRSELQALAKVRMSWQR